MATSYYENRNNIFEGTDKAAYKSFKSEIIRFKASSIRLDSIVNDGVKAGVNQLKASVSLNRLNALSLALKDCKESSRYAKISRIPEFLGLQNVLTFNKENAVFIFTDYAGAKALLQTVKIPTASFLAWCKENPAKKQNEALTEKQCAQKLRTLLHAMQSSPYIQRSDVFQDIMTAMQHHVITYDQEYQAINELNKMRNIINN